MHEIYMGGNKNNFKQYLNSCMITVNTSEALTVNLKYQYLLRSDTRKLDVMISRKYHVSKISHTAC